MFSLGQLVAAPGALQALTEAGQPPIDFLARHVHGDWGDVCQDDAAANDLAIAEGARIFSVYHTSAGTKIWIITEADRSSTYIVLPDEY